ncbi:pentapeptide repeat-containing protein [Enterobacter soli]|uniref:pentapeptide repeat-containing protein n=1 Tax=Enterobacter soli TaxID=885040 RepID=UPI002377D43A|nr:pentapeptide repeat-containing protein [Enterobacter soli]MDD9245462.1 pentapeptide repeat-containing protein [Enterobacter soli]
MQRTPQFKKFLKSARKHRKENFWDVCYNISTPALTNSVISDYFGTRSTLHTVDEKNISIEKEDIKSNKAAPDKNLLVEKVNFERCDFSGNNGGKKITFQDCIFHECYFSFSEFNDTTFKNCNFESCSFSQSKFFRCVFDPRCDFYRISLSGGTISFENTEINATKFFKYVYEPYIEQREVYASKNKKEHVEKYLLSKSIVKLSRKILASNQSCANDELYYDSVKNLYLQKLNEKQKYNSHSYMESIENINNKKKHSKSRKNKEHKYIIKEKSKVAIFFLKNLALPFERIITQVFGFVNGWGGSLQRMFFIGLCILFAYSIIYCVMDSGYVTYRLSNGVTEKIHVEGYYYIMSSIIKSFDITFLAGYTKHISNADGLSKQFTLLSNMLMGLFWYAVAIPSLINKISINRL